MGQQAQIIGNARPNAAILSNKCHFVLLKDAQKTAELNFDQHEELITELHPSLDEPEANGYRTKDYSFHRIKRHIHAAFTLWNVG